ncbi:hypothetical protein, partial [Brevibacterium sandarakinum]|uniref:hypothetical protein n=1 Tax=Brevibacterium sandarakinum TaxID=629680 RepID=UPI0026559D04
RSGGRTRSGGRSRRGGTRTILMRADAPEDSPGGSEDSSDVPETGPESPEDSSETRTDRA